MNILIKELPASEVASFRHVGHYLETHHAWHKMMAWAIPNGLVPPQQDFIGVSWDNPEDVAEDAFRYDVCVTLPEGFDKTPHTDIQFQTLPGGLYALYSFYGCAEEFIKAFKYMYGEWIPASEYDADDRPPLEVSMNNPAEDPEGKLKIDLYIPIKKKA